MKLLFCFVFFVSYCGTYGSPVIKAPEKDKPYDSCVCETFSCACCTTLVVPQIGLNDSACISFAYLPKDYGIALILEIDDHVLINETISARNPPPICLPIPYIEDFVDACVHFSDLKVTNTDFHGCASLEARMWWVYVVAEFSLGCWDTSGVLNKAITVDLVGGNSTKPGTASFIVGNVTSYVSDLNTKAVQMLKSMNTPSVTSFVTQVNTKAVQLFKNMNKPSIQDIHTNKI